MAASAGRTPVVATTFASVGVFPSGDRVIGEVHRRHRATEFRKFLDRIDAVVPTDLDVHLVLDLRHPQDTTDSPLAPATPTLSLALHTHLLVMDQPGGAV